MLYYMMSDVDMRKSIVLSDLDFGSVSKREYYV